MESPEQRLAAALAGVHEDSTMTMREAGRATGIDHATLHRYLSGEKEPRLATLLRICAGYHVTLREVLERAGLI